MTRVKELQSRYEQAVKMDASACAELLKKPGSARAILRARVTKARLDAASKELQAAVEAEALAESKAWGDEDE